MDTTQSDALVFFGATGGSCGRPAAAGTALATATRAGKNLPVTCTELMVRLRPVPTMYRQAGIAPNHFRFRVSPQIVGAFGMNAVAPDSDTDAQPIELSFQRELGGQDMDAYERVLTDAMNGDATPFARQDSVEEAWRVVDPVLKAAPVHPYAPQTWGPRETDRLAPPGGWHDPVTMAG